jgi:hypothetical protein
MNSHTPNLVTAEQLGQLLSPPVTKVMIRKYTLDGMVTAEPTRGPRGAVMYDRESALRELKQNRRQVSGQGGKRKNPGRKRKQSKDPGLMPEFDDAMVMREIDGRVDDKGRPIPPRDGISVLDLLKFGPSELEAVVKCAERVGLTPAHADLLLRMMQIKEKAIDMEVKTGKLVDKDTMNATYTQMLQAVQTRIMEIPAKAAARAASEMGIGGESQAVLRSVLERVVREQLSLLAG